MSQLRAVAVPLALIVVALTLGSCAERGARRTIQTSAAPKPIGPYSQAVQAGTTLYLSGQLGIDPATGELVLGGIERETRKALDNCRAILAAAGFDLEDVVQVQVFLEDMDDFGAMNRVYAEYFPRHPPARAAFEVADLPRNRRLVPRHHLGTHLVVLPDQFVQFLDVDRRAQARGIDEVAVEHR